MALARLIVPCGISSMVFGFMFGSVFGFEEALEPVYEALGMSGMLTTVSKLFAPIVWVLTASTNAMLRLFRVDPNEDEDEVTEEEIRMLVDAGSRKGILDAQETAFIQNVFEFDDRTAGEFATHRTDLTILWMEDSPEEWDQILKASRHTMYPVCEGTADHLLGVLNIKDYFYLTDRSQASILANAVKPAYFVPESVRADVLFRRMKESGNRFAVVMDEYGGMAGVVTMNDLLEQLVGDLDPADEHEEDKLETLEQLDEYTWSIGGGVPLDTVAEALALPLPVDRFDTFSGFVLGHYGLIPPDGQTLDLTMDGMQIHVVSIREHRIEQAIVTKLPQE